MPPGGTEGRVHMDQRVPHYRTSVWGMSRVRPEHFVPKHKSQQDKLLCEHLLKVPRPSSKQSVLGSTVRLIHFLREISPPEPFQPAHNPPSRHSTGEAGAECPAGAWGSCLGLTTHQSLQDPCPPALN